MNITLLSEYFDTWDPMGFIADGASLGEYSVEAGDIVLKTKHLEKYSNEELGNLIYEIFIKSIEIDPLGFRDACLERAPEIRKILEQK